MTSGNRDVQYRYGKNGELLRVYDNSQRLEVNYEYDVRGRETRRVYGNGVRQVNAYGVSHPFFIASQIDSATTCSVFFSLFLQKAKYCASRARPEVFTNTGTTPLGGLTKLNGSLNGIYRKGTRSDRHLNPRNPPLNSG